MKIVLKSQEIVNKSKVGTMVNLDGKIVVGEGEEITSCAVEVRLSFLGDVNKTVVNQLFDVIEKKYSVEITTLD